MSKDTGGPAFPIAYQHTNGDMERSQRWEGMTLRQWYAGQVIGNIYKEYFESRDTHKLPVDESWRHGLASEAFKIADAMIEENRR